MKKSRVIVLSIVALCLLVFAFWWGGNSPELRGFFLPFQREEETSTSIEEQGETRYQEQDNEEASCTIAVRCETVLNHMDWLSEGKRELIPSDGLILPPLQVSFEEGDSAFDLLRRQLQREGKHFEYDGSVAQNTVYIKGIANLYEFDCGERSGWLYYINGGNPSTGVSQYEVQPGDVIEWVYSCDYGNDVVLESPE